MRKPSVKLVPKTDKKVEQELTLLTGKPYVCAAQTDVVATFKRLGWRPPTEYKFKQPQ